MIVLKFLGTQPGYSVGVNHVFSAEFPGF